MRVLLAASLVIAAIAMPAAAQNAPNKVERARDRINTVWDARLAKMRNAQIESKCKADAKKQYWAIRFNKRRRYAEDCIAEAHTGVVDPAWNRP